MLITKGRNGTMSTGSPVSHSLRSRSQDALTPTRSLAEFFSDLAGSLLAGYSTFDHFGADVVFLEITAFRVAQ